MIFYINNIDDEIRNLSIKELCDVVKRLSIEVDRYYIPRIKHEEIIKEKLKGLNKMNIYLLIVYIKWIGKLLEDKKKELENKNNITDEEDVLYVEICKILKKIKKITIKYEEKEK